MVVVALVELDAKGLVELGPSLGAKGPPEGLVELGVKGPSEAHTTGHHPVV